MPGNAQNKNNLKKYSFNSDHCCLLLNFFLQCASYCGKVNSDMNPMMTELNLFSRIRAVKLHQNLLKVRYCQLLVLFHQVKFSNKIKKHV